MLRVAQTMNYPNRKPGTSSKDLNPRLSCSKCLPLKPSVRSCTVIDESQLIYKFDSSPLWSVCSNQILIVSNSVFLLLLASIIFNSSNLLPIISSSQSPISSGWSAVTPTAVDFTRSTYHRINNSPNLSTAQHGFSINSIIPKRRSIHYLILPLIDQCHWTRCSASHSLCSQSENGPTDDKCQIQAPAKAS